jgi:hypothetical protein
MNYLVKLAIPIGLAIVAVVLNLMASAHSQQLIQFVSVRTDIAPAQPITEDALAPISIPIGTAETLKGVVLPWSERAVLFGRPAPLRGLKKGDIVFYRDANPDPGLNLEPGEVAMHLPLEGLVTGSLPAIVNVGDEITFWVYRPVPVDPKGVVAGPKPKGEPIGPFRIVSLGKKVTRDFPEAPGSGSSDQRDISFAVRPDPKDPQKPNPEITKLIEVRQNRPPGTEVVVEINKLRPKTKK